MPKQGLAPEKILAQYITMSDQLKAALAGLSDVDFDLARTPEAWTIREIVHHISEKNYCQSTDAEPNRPCAASY